MAGFGQVRSEVYDRVSRSQYYRDNLAGLTAHQRHQRLLAELNKGSQQEQDPDTAAAAALASTVTDEDVLRQHHRFLRSAADDAQDNPTDWGVRLAKRYYARLFKEYAIADLSRYKEGKVGMRWRTKVEVESGKGQFTCGAKGCHESLGLASYEVNFSYVEAGESKQALVKLRLCPDCAAKLHSTREKGYSRVGQVAAALQHQPVRRDSISKDREHHQRQKRKHKSRNRDRDRDRGRAEEVRGDDDGVEQDRSSFDVSKRRRHSEAQDYTHQEQQRLHSSSPEAAAPGPPAAAAERCAGAESSDADRCPKGDVVNDADIERWLDDVFAAA